MKTRTCTKQATTNMHNFVLAFMSSMTSSCRECPYFPRCYVYLQPLWPQRYYVYVYTDLQVWTHQVIAMINSGIGTDSHFNLVHDVGYTPLGYIVLHGPGHPRPPPTVTRPFLQLNFHQKSMGLSRETQYDILFYYVAKEKQKNVTS